ncbi:MAG: AIR synthase related protein, partial [Candidatus Micrarchaeota archaeon]
MREATYSAAGVDRDLRAKAKRFSFNAPVALKTPYNDLFELSASEYYLVTCDGVGTKALLAEMAEKYDSIGIDAVAMVVNDAIRCGAKPEAVVDILDVRRSNPKFISELTEGIKKGADEAGCFIAGGETADVPELVANGFSLNTS